MAKKSIKSLSDLKSLKFKDKDKNKKEPEMPKAVQKVLDSMKKKPAAIKTEEKAIEQIDDDQAFMNAMSGVQRIDNSTVTLQKQKPAPAAKIKDEDDGKEYLSNLVSGKIEFEIEYSDEFMFGFVRGTDTKDIPKAQKRNIQP